MTQRRPARERHRDQDPLELAARELMRVVAHAARPGRACCTASSSSTAARARGGASPPCRGRQGLGDLVADGQHRIERRQRLLEDERDLGAADRPHRGSSAPKVAQQIDGPGIARGQPRIAAAARAATSPGSRAPSSDLPLPDSPTSPSVSPGATTVKLMSCTTGVGHGAGREADRAGAETVEAEDRPIRYRPARRSAMVLAEDAPHRVGDLADGGVRLDGRENRRHEVVGAARRGLDGRERRAPRRPRSGSRARPARAPPGARSISGSRSGTPRSAARSVDSCEAVDADDDRRRRCRWPAAPGRRTPESRAGRSPTRSPPAFRPSASMRSSSARASASSRSVSRSMVYDAAERIHRVRDAGLGRDDLLRPQRNPRRVLGRQRQRLVAAVAVQRLRAAEDGGQRLDGDADDVVVRLLRRERAAGRLRVEAQLLRPRAWSRRTARA